MPKCTDTKCNDQFWTGYGWDPCGSCRARWGVLAAERERLADVERAESAVKRTRLLRVLGAHGAIIVGLWLLSEDMDSGAPKRTLVALTLFYPFFLGPILHLLYDKFIKSDKEH